MKSVFRKTFPPSLHNCGRDAVPGPEVPRIVLEKRIQAATSASEAAELTEQLRNLLGMIIKSKESH